MSRSVPNRAIDLAFRADPNPRRVADLESANAHLKADLEGMMIWQAEVSNVVNDLSLHRADLKPLIGHFSGRIIRPVQSKGPKKSR